MRSLYIVIFCSLSFLALAGPKPDPVVAMGVEVQPENISCTGRNDGSFRITLLSNGGVVIYQWSSLGPDTLQGIGTLSGNSPSDYLDSLPPGDYLFKVLNFNGADTTFGASIVEPPPIGGYARILSNFGGYDVACQDGPGTGMTRADVSGGTSGGYNYQWSSGATSRIALNLRPGAYSVTVSDVNGCAVVLDVTLEAPPPLSAQVEAQATACLGQASGRVEIAAVGGGVAPYSLLLEGESPDLAGISWDSLPAGVYAVVIRDANGCLLEQDIDVPAGAPFPFTMGPDAAVFSGDTLLISPQSDRPLTAMSWSPQNGLQEDPATGAILFFPFNATEYQVLARDENGCLALDTLQIRVHRNRSLYFPNVLAPNANEPENQYFSIYSDAGVRSVLSLQIFDRAGRLWFDKNNFPVNAAQEGWHGEGAGEQAPPGVYFWQAVVLFSDARRETFQGDVTLLR